MIEQYNNYSINNITVNGIATQVREERERERERGTPASNRNNQNRRTVVLRPHLFISMTKLSRPDSGQTEQMTFQLDN